LCFIENNFSELSPEAANYLTQYERPLFQLEQMLPFSLHMENAILGYDEGRANEALEIIERKIQSMIDRPIDEPHGIDAQQPQKRVINGYEEKYCIEFAGKSTVLAENPAAENPYLVCNIKSDNPLNLEERYNGVVTDNYVEAMREFVTRIDGLVGELEAERSASGLEINKLTTAECLPDSKKMDWNNQLIIVKADILAPEYRSAEHQLALCTGGFGASPNASGRAVYVEELHSGKKARYDRYQIAGIADTAKLPEWARDKLNLLQEIKETPGVFKFGDYHFAPHRKFEKGEVERPLEGDSRPWKMDAQFAMRNMSSDRSLELSNYDWSKTEYSHAKFFEASGNSECDIFRCLENGKLYVPSENELFRYNEPPQITKSEVKPTEPEAGKKPAKKPTLQEKLDNAKQKAAAQEPGKGTPGKTKKQNKDGRD
jgi:hypothetical protein